MDSDPTSRPRPSRRHGPTVAEWQHRVANLRRSMAAVVSDEERQLLAMELDRLLRCRPPDGDGSVPPGQTPA